MRRLLAMVVLLWPMFALESQPVMTPRANVAAYDGDEGIDRLAYRESPYYLELSGSWKQQHTDSSVIYRRQLDVDKVWKEYLVFLNVRCGRACRVYVNDKEVGYEDDSRLWHEFSLDKYLKYGKPNTLTIEAMLHPQGALLEDSTLSVGLNGEPYLLFKTDPCISDMAVSTDYEAGNGTLGIDVQVYNSRRKGRYYVEVEVWDPKGQQLDRMGRWVIFDKKSEELVDMSRTWSGVLPWNAEQPMLYTAVVRLRNEKMEEEETVATRFGFRRVEVKDGTLQLNGKPITVKGVVYGIEHTEGYASREQMLRDVVTMKNNNINAVRTARFSPMDAYFYELCDQYGLYVVADANLLPVSTQRRALATEHDFIPAFEQRVEHLYGKYKNHSSIIAWSLGNSMDNGVCMTAAYRRMKALDRSRPVIFSGADYGDATDIIAPIKPSVSVLEQSLAKASTRPFLMLASVGRDDFAQLEPLWQLVKNNRSLQGGFVDIWPLGSVLLSELRQLYSPFDVSLSKISPDEGEFIVYNCNDFSGLNHYSLDYTIYTNLRPNIIAGDLPVAASGGGVDKVSMRIPQLDLTAGEELFIRFNLSRRGKNRSEVGKMIFRLNQPTAPKHRLETGREEQSDGMIASTIHRLMLRFEGHDRWSAEMVDSVVRHPNRGTTCVDALWRYVSEVGTAMCDVRTTYVFYGGNDVVVEYTVSAADGVKEQLKPTIDITGCSGDSVAWFGLDREVVFQNSNSGVIGTYYRPKSNMTRQQVRWAAVYGEESSTFVRVLDGLCGVTIDADRLTVAPQSQNNFRLHIGNGYSRQDVPEILSTDYPPMSTGALEPPVIESSAARFSQPLTITIKGAPNATIRYTLDGTEPTSDSPIYSDPIVLTATTIIKAKQFAEGTPSSFTTTRRFYYDYIVKTTFSRKPNTPYNVGADTILNDGERGSIDDLTHGWVGFSGSSVVTIVELSKNVDIETIALRFAHVPATWAFAPKQVRLTFSSDGTNYSNEKVCEIPFDPASQDNAEARVAELLIPIHLDSVGYVKIEPLVVEKIPVWHRAKGLKPWLLMDEISVSERMASKNENGE